MDKIDELSALIDRVGLTHYGKSLRSKNKHLLYWIMEQTSEQPNEVSLGERVYIVLNGQSETTCEYGSRKIFNTLNKGYRFCASDCRCRREEQSRKITKHLESLPDDERDRRVKAHDKTMMDRYGVSNAMHVEVFKDKLVATNLERMGVMYPWQSEVVRQKMEETNQERYGGHPASTQEVKDRIKKTNFEKYGVESSMHVARAAFAEQSGTINPFSLPEYQAKAKRTMLAKYGTEHALKNPDILAKMVSDVEAKYGVKSMLFLPENMALSDAPSKIGTAWLDSLGVPVREYKIDLDQTYAKADGYDPATNTVYLFHGDFWHGNPNVFVAEDINQKNGKTFGQLYENTMKVERMISERGYNLITIWEREWKATYKKLRKQVRLY